MNSVDKPLCGFGIHGRNGCYSSEKFSDCFSASSPQGHLLVAWWCYGNVILHSEELVLSMTPDFKKELLHQIDCSCKEIATTEK